MKHSTVISRIEHSLFEFTYCINEFHALLDELTMTDMKYIEKNLKKLNEVMQEKQRQWAVPLYQVS